MAKKVIPLVPELLIRDCGEVAQGTGCPLVNVHLVDAFEGGRDCFLSTVRMLKPVADKWAEWFELHGVTVTRDQT